MAEVSETQRALLLSEVFGGLGHEFNNIFSRVICLAEDIQEEADLLVIREHAETLIMTAERGAELVRQHMANASGLAAAAPARDLKRDR